MYIYIILYKYIHTFMYRKYLLEIEQKQNAETASMWAISEKYRFAKAKNKKIPNI